MNAAIIGIQTAAAGKTIQDYSSDWMLRHALQRAIEIISEASRSLPDDVRATRPEIPWQRVKTIGNVIRHEYHGLSDPILWSVIIDEIPQLERAVSALMEQYP
nr:HepT-like ribonuclease domain-containing protein [Rhizobium quercicola]